MDFTSFMKKYADQINGQYIEYNSNLSVIIVPVAGNRFQTVMGNIKQSALYNRKVITFTSKVCPMTDSIDFKMLLEHRIRRHIDYVFSDEFDCSFVLHKFYMDIRF